MEFVEGNPCAFVISSDKPQVINKCLEINLTNHDLTIVGSLLGVISQSGVVSGIKSATFESIMLKLFF